MSHPSIHSVHRHPYSCANIYIHPPLLLLGLFSLSIFRLAFRCMILGSSQLFIIMDLNILCFCGMYNKIVEHIEQ